MAMNMCGSRNFCQRGSSFDNAILCCCFFFSFMRGGRIKYHYWRAIVDPHARPRSAVGNVSGYKCVCDCRSRGREFDPDRYHTFMEIDHKIIYTVIILPSADSFNKGCCQLQAKVCARIFGKLLSSTCPGKSVVS